MSSKVSGLLSQQLDRVLQSEMIAPGLNKSFPVLLPFITSINKAHPLMLEHQQIINRDTARRLASAIPDIVARAVDPRRSIESRRNTGGPSTQDDAGRIVATPRQR
jgi:hypothetical protein